MPMNYARTGLLLAALTGIFVAMGALIGGATGMVIAFFVALAMNAFSLWQSDKMVLRMYGAEEVDAQRAAILPHVQELPSGRGCRGARLCMNNRSTTLRHRPHPGYARSVPPCIIETLSGRSWPGLSTSSRTSDYDTPPWPWRHHRRRLSRLAQYLRSARC